MTLQDRLTSEAEFETDEPIPMVAYEAVIYTHKLEKLLRRCINIVHPDLRDDIKLTLDSNE